MALRISPATWGPFFWHTIHLAALGYPISPTYTEKKAAKDFYESLTSMLPCPACRLHYTQMLQENPITPFLDTRRDLFQWTVKIHNLVNKRLEKPEVSESDSIAYYIRLGTMERSPVWTPADFEAAEYKSFLKGLAGGAVASGMIGAVLFWLNK
jgi:hypothetical protein